MNIINFILENTDSPLEEIHRCLKKSSMIIAEDGMVFVGNKEYIYYFVIEKKKRNSKEFKSFYKKSYPFMKGKLFFAKNVGNYKNRCEQIKEYTPVQKDIFLFRWL